jgi:hypothetical protein
MSQQIVLKEITETETVCTNCRYFMESEGLFFCNLYGAFLSAETLDIPCDFQENDDIAAISSVDE